MDSLNVFFHLTYPGSVDLVGRGRSVMAVMAAERQIECFGQSCGTLFSKPHARREVGEIIINAPSATNININSNSSNLAADTGTGTGTKTPTTLIDSGRIWPIFSSVWGCDDQPFIAPPTTISPPSSSSLPSSSPNLSEACRPSGLLAFSLGHVSHSGVSYLGKRLLPRHTPLSYGGGGGGGGRACFRAGRKNARRNCG